MNYFFSTRRDGTFTTYQQRLAWVTKQYPQVQYYETTQAHTDSAVAVNGHTPQAMRSSVADALVYRKNQDFPVMLGIKTADCVPILLEDAAARVIAAIHSGWKGTLSHIVAHALALMRTHGAHMAHTQAVLGPAINACCYTIPPERAALFRAAGFSVAGNSISLARAVYQQLCAEGINSIHYQVCCTSCQDDRYYSFRREGKAHGTIISLLWL